MLDECSYGHKTTGNIRVLNIQQGQKVNDVYMLLLLSWCHIYKNQAYVLVN